VGRAKLAGTVSDQKLLTTKRVLLLALGVAAVVELIYALTLLPSSKTPAIQPPAVEEQSPATAVEAPALPRGPAPAPAPHEGRTPTSATEPATSGGAPMRLEDLRLTEAETDEIKPVLLAAHERVLALVKEHHPVQGQASMGSYDAAVRRVETELTVDLARTLGAERAKQFLQVTRGRLPGMSPPPEAAAQEPPAQEPPAQEPPAQEPPR